ncbi:MAG: SLC13 family permease [Pseudohongiellaceae bacterium]|jgi:di/tricarboxylate transporter
MSLAWLSVIALVIAVTLSCTTAVNIGVLSMSLALIIGVFFGDMSPGAVLNGFPVNLFTTLLGVTLLFSIAESNGTLSRVTGRAVALCRGHAGWLPVMFFMVGFGIATIGAGATPASALLAPPAMAIAGRAKIPPLVMAIMAGNGVLAGTLSPFAPTGIVAHGVMEQIGLGGVEWYTFAFNALAHALVGVGGFFMFGGWKLFKNSTQSVALESHDMAVMEKQHWLTIAGIIMLIILVAGFSFDVGMVALIIATVLILLRTVDEAVAIKGIPWSVILMVTGVTVLITLLRETEGLDLITTGIANVATAGTINPIVAFTAGIISVYSSTSGVVLPAFLPMVPSLAEQLGMDPLNIAWSMNVSASLVDLSSLSTVGALYIASAPAGTDTRKFFNALLAWGMSMALVGALLCKLAFG